MARAYVGTSGWSYKHWRDGVFYPPKLASTKWLAYLAERFDTVELNASFYRWPKAESVETWGQTGPDTFRFAIKVWRGFTHYKRLEDPKGRLGDFLALFDNIPQHKRGPLLLQLPPQMDVDAIRLDRFLGTLATYGWQTAVEFRNGSWLTPGVRDVLARHGVALCVHDMKRAAPVLEPNDAPFVYMRRHGPGPRYSGSYSDAMLEADAAAIRSWVDGGRDVYVYFNNDQQGNAVRNAATLRHMLGLPPIGKPATRETVVKVVDPPAILRPRRIRHGARTSTPAAGVKVTRTVRLSKPKLQRPARKRRAEGAAKARPVREGGVLRGARRPRRAEGRRLAQPRARAR